MADKGKIVNTGVSTDGNSVFVVKKELPEVKNADTLFQRMLHTFKTSPLGNSFKNEKILNSMNDKVVANTYYQLNKLKTVTGDDISKFLNKTLANNSTFTGANLGVKSMEDLFNSDSNNFGAFFFERYKNINNQYEDLRIITEYLYELQEAVTTMRDNIVGADDLVSMISRELKFDGVTATDNNTSLITAIEQMEKDYKIKERLKKLILPGVLTYGNFFVYTIPYKDIFAQFNHRRKTDMINGMDGAVHESGVFFHPVIESTIIEPTNTKRGGNSVKYSPVIESLTKKYNDYCAEWNENVTGKNTLRKVSEAEIDEELRSVLEGIEISNDPEYPFMEDGSLLAFNDPSIRDQALKEYRKVSKPDFKSPFISGRTTQDAVIDPSSTVDKSDIREYKDVGGVFIKLYEPERIIPVYIMDTCVGYYVLYESFGEIRNSILLNSSLNRTNLAFAQTKRKQLDDEVINIIADSICQSIDKKYVTKNPKFKELMVNAISYQDFYKKQFKVQFVSVSYMTHFKINEDPDTHMGESVLKKSMFYAKLYLSLLLFKIITILTKSNDQRVYYIKTAGIRKDQMNRLQEIAREIKDKQISFNDLASIQTIFSKVGAYKEAFVPVGKSGEKSIEFDILSGQDVQLNTDLMELLRKGMINNCGVPSVILSYMEEADFAKTLTMQHSKYMSRIISMQTEIEENVTEWYKKLMTFDNTIPDNDIEDFSFNFTRPNTLNGQNLADLIGNAENLAEFITKIEVGEDDQAKSAKLKQHLIKNVFLNGVFNWSEFDKTVKRLELELKVDAHQKELTSNDENGGGY